MAGFEARFERLELKYVIDEHSADRIRRDIQPFCQSDSHNDSQSDSQSARPGATGRCGYLISSLYLDSPGLAFFHAKERGDADRLKLRVRTYPGSDGAVLELKRRVSDVISKTRAKVRRDQAEAIVRGRIPRGFDPTVEHFLDEFALTAARSGAGPTLHVRYDREAYSSHVDTYARVTFDRRIEAQRTSSWSLEPPESRWCSFDQYRRREERDRSVVLEIKCQSVVPWWVTNLIQTHALKRRSFSKYGIGIYLTAVQDGAGRVSRRSAKALV